tara:strand:+ start:583 stop:993 length:411 start_codon:yes stop_codon:yes gene_type:complete
MAASFGLSLMSFYQQGKMIKGQTKFMKKKNKYDDTQARTFLLKEYNARKKKRILSSLASGTTLDGTPMLIEEDEESKLNEELDAAVISMSMRNKGIDYSARSQEIGNAFNLFGQTTALGMSLINYRMDKARADKGL